MPSTPRSTPPHPPGEVPEAAWWALLAALAAWGLANLQWGRAVGWDEVEFLRATDWIRQGQVPYRDFFEHHTPLAWYLMAPFESLCHRPGVAPILWLRWIQVPVWGLALWRLHAWLKEMGGSAGGRIFSLACLLGTPFFVFSALEYRVDTFGTCLMILGLDRLRRSGARSELAAGALLTASVLANLRFGPLAVLVAIAASLMDLEARAWRFQGRRMARLAAGSAAALAPWVIYLLATRSLGDMWHWCYFANKVSAALSRADRDVLSYLLNAFTNWDFPGLALEAGMVWGGWLAAKRLRRPGFLQLLLVAQAANLAFIAYMKVQYLYHFELSLCLAVPFTFRAFDDLSARMKSPRTLPRLSAGLLAAAVLVNGSTLVNANDHPALRYQDSVLKDAARLAPPGTVVLDGCGWVLGAKPAYRFWFLPVLSRVLCFYHLEPYYTPADLMAHPPGLVIADARVENLTKEDPGLGEAITTPSPTTTPHLWVPGLSRLLTQARPSWEWPVLKTGDYQIVCHPDLAKHPWFLYPFAVTDPVPRPTSDFTLDPASFQSEGLGRLRWSINGVEAAPVGGRLHLNAGDLLQVSMDPAGGALGLFLVPAGTGRIFIPPPPDLTLDYVNFYFYWPRR